MLLLNYALFKQIHTFLVSDLNLYDLLDSKPTNFWLLTAEWTVFILFFSENGLTSRCDVSITAGFGKYNGAFDDPLATIRSCLNTENEKDLNAYISENIICWYLRSTQFAQYVSFWQRRVTCMAYISTLTFFAPKLLHA